MEALKSRAEILSAIESVCKDNDIHKYDITDVKTNQKGEGYLGEIFMVTVKDTRSGRKFDMVIKAAFMDEKVRQIAPIAKSFQNEIYFYKEVYPAYQNLEKEHGISKHVEYVPKCFQVSVKEQNEMLVLENLRMSGFEMFDKKMILDDDHVKLIFKTYGRFHGYSFVLKDQKPEEYEKLVGNCHNIYAEFMKNDFFANHLTEINKTVVNTFVPEEDNAIINRYEKYEGRNISDIFNEVIEAEVDYTAILHGDCWSNNMMFKYEDTADGRRPTDMRLIDFQIIKTGSPVCDLSYCLYSGASKKVFDNLNEYLELYYKSFSSFVKELGSDPEKLFPFSALKEHWRKYSKFGMIMAFAILRMKLTNKEDIVDLTDGFEIDQMSEVFRNMRYNEEDYNKRIRGLIWHMHEVDAL